MNKELVRSFGIVLVSSILGLPGALLAETPPGPAEAAGQKVDQAAAVAGQKYEATKESLGVRAGQAGAYMDDTAITAKVKAEIFRDPALKVLQISVTTTNGVVNLSGAVDSQQSIDRAVTIARYTQDVRLVENALVIKSVQ